jgi:N-acetylglutamate synthase
MEAIFKPKMRTALPSTKPQDLELIAALEQSLLQVWPAVKTHMIDGWAVRFAGGYTGRANSASAIVPGAHIDNAFVTRIVEMYDQEKLTPQFRVSPVASSDTAKILQQRGFVSRGLAHTMIADIKPQHLAHDLRVHLSSHPDMSWCLGVTSRQEKAKRNPDALHAIVNRIQVPVQFATVVIEGEALGFGIAAIDRGWMELGSIVMDEKHRGKGLGRALVSTLLRWATEQQVEKTFLQVEVGNATALALYRSLGFDVLYDYDTLFLPVSQVSAPPLMPYPVAPN